MPDWLETGNLLTPTFFGNTWMAWLIAFAIMVATYVGLLIVRKVILVRLQAIADRTSTRIDNMIVDVLSRTGLWFTSYLSLYVGSRYVVLSGSIDMVMGRIAVIVLLLQVTIWGNRLITNWILEHLSVKYAGDPSMRTMMGVLSFVSRLIFFSAVLLMGLQNLNVKIDTLLAGLGIGGIAIALAVQSVLGDLFASLSIVFDRPFLIGDFIILDNGMLGTVEQIGLKTTRLRAFTGEELVISNNDLLQTRIRNYRRMKSRMVNFTLNVTYQTPHDKLKRIPEIIKAIVQADQRTKFEWAHFAAFGSHSLDFDVAFMVGNYEWYSFMKTREDIYLEIVRLFTEEGIEFAYPTQTLFVSKTTEA